MAHTAEELSRFQDGETRLVYARRRDNPGETEFMPEGTAREMRERTKRELMCIVDGCVSPDLTTVSRSKARDGFSHLSGGGHANLGMGIHHLQAEHALERWVKMRHPALLVELEYTTADGARRADLMVTDPGNGKQVALEVQYASLSVAAWQERRNSYRNPDRDIRDFWIFGHTGDQFRVAPGSMRREVKLNALQEALIAAGDVPLWFNPAENKVAWAMSPHRSGLLARAGVGELVIRPLEEFTLTRWGLSHPELDEARRKTAQVLAQEQHESEERERQQREQAAAEAAEAERHRRVAKAREDAYTAWQATGGEMQVSDRLDGIFPDWLQFVMDPFLHVPAAQWQSHLYLTLIRGQPTGTLLPVRAMVDTFVATYGTGDSDEADIRKAIWAWVWELNRVRVLRVGTVRSQGRKKYSVVVGHPSSAEFSTRGGVDPGADRQREIDLRWDVGPSWWRPGLLATTSGKPLCRKCELPLAEVYWVRGTHEACRSRR